MTLPDVIARLAKAPPSKTNLKVVKATSLGWMRLPEGDSETAVCWETPSGVCYACSREGPKHLLVRLHGKVRDRFVLVEVL